MKLIIAEKPALVSAIADALDGPRKSLQGSTYMTRRGLYADIRIWTLIGAEGAGGLRRVL